MTQLTSTNRAVCRVGLVGTGGVAARHAAVLAGFDDVELVAATDLDLARAAAFGRTHQVPVAPDLAALLAAGLDAAYLCVPPSAHGEPEHQLAEAGVALFIEKPLAADQSTAERIGDHLAATGVPVRVGLHWRGADPIQQAKELLAGRQIRLVSGSWLDKVPPVGWWTDRRRSGGPLIEQAVHVIDTARVLAGDITSVHAISAGPIPGGSVDAATAAIWRFSSGAVGTLSTTCVLDGKHRAGLEIVTDGLVVGVGEDWLDVHDDTGRRRVEFDPWAARIAADRAFIDALRGNAGDPDRDPPIYAEALRSHRVACALARSAACGRPEQIR